MQAHKKHARVSCCRRLLCLLVLTLCVRSAAAHSTYQASVMLDFHGDTVAVELQLPPSRLGTAFGQEISAGTLQAQQQALAEYIRVRVQAYAPSHQPFGSRLTGPLEFKTIDGADYVVAHLALIPPTGAGTGTFLFEDDVILDKLPTNVALVSIRSDWRSSTFANDPQLLGVLDGDTRSVTVDRTGGTWWKGFGTVFHLGLRHIAEGTDHLLFLLALLLPAPLLAVAGRWQGPSTVRHGLLRVLKVVTAFTIGHSTTLALATFGLVRVPEQPIEVLIALSILVSAVHALRPLFPGREGYIAAGFGLVHGLAFASTLAELGLTRWERVASIVAFNVGIETMQLVVVAAILPSLLILSRTPVYSVFRIAGAVLAGVAAASWAIQRTFSVPNPIDRWVEQGATHGIAIAATLFLGSIVSWLVTRSRPAPFRRLGDR